MAESENEGKVESEGSLTSSPINNPIIEMQINDIRKKVDSCQHDQSISTPKLAAFGVTDCYLQFYPKGSFWCTKEGHFSVLFGCPATLEVDLLMYAGRIIRKPQELLTNEETNETVYGLHDFGEIKDLLDEPAASSSPGEEGLAIGVEFLSIAFKESAEKESDKIVRVTVE